jgi:hypothetical protein
MFPCNSSLSHVKRLAFDRSSHDRGPCCTFRMGALAAAGAVLLVPRRQAAHDAQHPGRRRVACADLDTWGGWGGLGAAAKEPHPG